MQAHFLDSIPILVLYAGRILPYIAPVETGYLLGDRRHKRTEYDGYSRATQCANRTGRHSSTRRVSAGLYLIPMAESRFASRRAPMIHNTNAIGTAFLRADQIPEPHSFNSCALFATMWRDGSCSLSVSRSGVFGDLAVRQRSGFRRTADYRQRGLDDTIARSRMCDRPLPAWSRRSRSVREGVDAPDSKGAQSPASLWRSCHTSSF